MNRYKGEEGQMMVAAAAMLVLFLIIAAVVLNVGWWLRDKRDAQNDVDAAVLAGAQDLPYEGLASAAAGAWAADNNVDVAAGHLQCCEFLHMTPDGPTEGPANWIHATVERPAGRLEKGLLDIEPFNISASAAAAKMRAVASCVMPWGVLGDENDPPPAGTWGIVPEKLYFFHSSDPSTPGNFGALRLYGKGTPGYTDAIKNECGTDPKHGCASGEPIGEDDTLQCSSEPGGFGINTCRPLAERYGGDCKGNAGSAAACDAARYIQALDKADNDPGCRDRKVPVPVIDAWPRAGASDPVVILGIATFYIAGWDRKPPYGNVDVDSDGVEDDAMVWGYFLPNQPVTEAWKIRWGFSDDPFAPIKIVLVE